MFLMKEFWNEFCRRLKDPFNILVVYTLLLAVVDQFHIGPWPTLLRSALVLALILLLAMVANRFLIWHEANSSTVKFYSNWAKAPREYTAIETLKYLANNKGKLEIIGRTCFRWLCGDENSFDNDKELFKRKQTELQDQIRKAIEHGSSIVFVLQNPNILMPNFTE